MQNVRIVQRLLYFYFNTAVSCIFFHALHLVNTSDNNVEKLSGIVTCTVLNFVFMSNSRRIFWYFVKKSTKIVLSFIYINFQDVNEKL